MKRVLSMQLVLVMLAAATSCVPQCAPCPPPYELQTRVAVFQTRVAGASAAPVPSEVPPTSTLVPMTASSIPPTTTPVPPAPTCAPPAPCPTCLEEALVITSPGSGDTVSSPVLVAGISNPTFEQSLAIQVIGADGTVIGEGAATISADWGRRGNFEAQVVFDPPPSDQSGRIIVLDASPRDGGLLHLSSVEVTLVGT
ncbi:MAG TPA: Gmad2 immunoglobulin-like domain-containing protein [Anaerolineae bacterium]|nr:Gmad2 immunoglobulin-like domain-containing protein [Anaerolineae bacterium]